MRTDPTQHLAYALTLCRTWPVVALGRARIRAIAAEIAAAQHGVREMQRALDEIVQDAQEDAALEIPLPPAVAPPAAPPPPTPPGPPSVAPGSYEAALAARTMAELARREGRQRLQVVS